MTSGGDPFQIWDCWTTYLATGLEADSLVTFRDGIGEVGPSSLVAHYVSGAARPSFERRQFNTDFANWAGSSLNDQPLAERLALIMARDADELRGQLLEVLGGRIDEIGDVYASEPFRFVDRQIAAYPTELVVEDPGQLLDSLDRISDESIFYHVVDAPWRRGDGHDDLTGWIQSFGSEWAHLAAEVEAIDARFLSVQEIRGQLVALREGSLV